MAALLLLAVAAAAAGAQEARHEVGQVKAAFLFNFAKYVQWSDRAEAGPMLFCVAGETPMRERLGLLDGRRVREEVIEVRRLAAGDRPTGCRLLFVGEGAEKWRGELLAAADDGYALTVSDRAGFIEAGGMIELYMEGERVRFAVNLDALRGSRMTVSSRLLRLARRVIEEGRARR